MIIRGQVLHSNIPLLDRSIFIEKTSAMHLRFPFYIFTDFRDPFFVRPRLSIVLEDSRQAKAHKYFNPTRCHLLNTAFNSSNHPSSV